MDLWPTLTMLKLGIMRWIQSSYGTWSYMGLNIDSPWISSIKNLKPLRVELIALQSPYFIIISLIKQAVP